MVEKVREFETGATRSVDIHRIDPEGFLSPLVLERYSEYMRKHQVQADGKLRDSDNWQKGMPLNSYIKGGWRHFLHWWTRHRGYAVNDPGAASDIEEDLCALFFNVQGYLHELLKAKHAQHSSIFKPSSHVVGISTNPADYRPKSAVHGNSSSEQQLSLDGI